jgi:hypothetical protein
MDPTAVEFTASSDHDALGPNGQPLVFRYELLLYAAGSSSPTTVASLGKPSPDDGGTIRMALASIFNPMPAGGIVYEARIAAVGAGGSGISDPSNSFSFPVTCTYAVTPSTAQSASAVALSAFLSPRLPDARGAHPRAKDGSEWPAAVRESAVTA